MNIMKAHEHPDVTTHWKGLIWPEALDVPFQCFVRQILKGPTAAFLDEALTNIAHARAPLVRQVGRRLSKIREKDLFAVLGKSSFKDYVAEHLELGCRSAQEMARTAEALERLPLLRQASDESLVTSCHVRDLVRVVTPETEAEWVEKAVKVTVRGLRVEILRQIEAGKLPEDAKPEADDDSVKVSFEAPPWFRSKLDTAVDLFRKMEGFAGASRASAAEAMAAEWLSGAPLPGAAETATDGARPGGEPCGRDDQAAPGSPAEPTGPLARPPNAGRPPQPPRRLPVPAAPAKKTWTRFIGPPWSAAGCTGPRSWPSSTARGWRTRSGAYGRSIGNECSKRTSTGGNTWTTSANRPPCCPRGSRRTKVPCPTIPSYSTATFGRSSTPGASLTA